MLIGGLGFIGRQLVKTLSGACECVVFSDLEGVKNAARFVGAFHPRIIVGDVTDTTLTKVIHEEQPDAVVHLAAITGLAKCNENPYRAFSTNVFGTHNVVVGCLSRKTRLIFISSREVYGDSESGPTSEDARLAPNNTYGVTKLLAERLVLWAAERYGLDYTILRLTNVYGPGGDQYNIQAMIRSALSSGVIPVFGGGQQFNLIFVEDVAAVIKACMEAPQASRQIFNVGSRDTLTIEDVLGKLASNIHCPFRIERREMRQGETVSFQPSIDKLEHAFGPFAWKPFDEGLKKTIRWYEAEGNSSATYSATKDTVCAE